jgi:hypothetical protein
VPMVIPLKIKKGIIKFKVTKTNWIYVRRERSLDK